MTSPHAPFFAGMLLFDKPKNWTSHDAVEALRRRLPKGAKAGHCGTLDPLATGLLILLVGPATRWQARMQSLDKVYSGTIRFGVSTDTGDIQGKTLEEKPVPALTLEALQKALNVYQGTVEMPAPAYSAVKHHGKPLYHYARKGIQVPPKPRVSRIYRWEALSYENSHLKHRLVCSSGTYVRSLAEAVGRDLGCGATVSELRREKVGPFTADEALSLEALRSMELAALHEWLGASQRRLASFLSSPHHNPS